MDIDNSEFKACFKTCKTCDKAETTENHNCKECKPNYNSLNNSTNCYKICDYLYYLDESNKINLESLLNGCHIIKNINLINNIKSKYILEKVFNNLKNGKTLTL